MRRQSVCRDFAHLMITLSRTSGIPALCQCLGAGE
ncbi:MAG: transglutaminase-like domain-containing protein [Sneathiella sp.]|nr:transglutaminase-like domain-containing protein [Sneathiella sp.]